MTVQELYQTIEGDYSAALKVMMMEPLVKRMIVKLLDDHRKGRFDNSRRIWTVFIFLQWYEVYFHEEN